MVGDFNGDNFPDLAVANRYAHTVSILLGNGDGTFGPFRSFGVTISPSTFSSLTLGDFNGDKIPDLAVANSDAANVSVLLGRGDWSFELAQHLGVGISPQSIAVGDFNGDQIPDLAVANQHSSSVTILINDSRRIR